MDTKRNTSEDFKKQAGLKAKKAIADFTPDVVIASDDNGTKRFAEEHTKIPAGNIACRQWKPKARGF
jgi:hypothetical protein